MTTPLTQDQAIVDALAIPMVSTHTRFASSVFVERRAYEDLVCVKCGNFCGPDVIMANRCTCTAPELGPAYTVTCTSVEPSTNQLPAPRVRAPVNRQERRAAAAQRRRR